MFTFEELDKTLNNFDQKAIQKFIHDIQNRIEKGKSVKTFEADYFCRFLDLAAMNIDDKSSKISLESIPVCENYIFDKLYLMYWYDLHGVEEHYDSLNNKLPRNKVKEDLNNLQKVYQNWEQIILKERHKEELLEHLTIETRKHHLKKLKKDRRFYIDGKFYENNSYRFKKKQIILHSKFIYNSVKLLFEKADIDFLQIELWNKNIVIDKKSIIHILFGHFSAAIKDYQKKSYHNRDIRPNEILKLLTDILNKIDLNIPAPTNFPEKIYFNLKNRYFAIWIPKPRNINENIRLTTFYPVEERYELDRIENDYREHEIEDNLIVFVQNA